MAVATTVLHLGALAALVRRAGGAPLHAGLLLLATCWLVPNLVPWSPLQFLLDPSLHLDHWRDGVTIPWHLADMMPPAALAIAAGLLPNSLRP